jgi:hypothetical protein
LSAFPSSSVAENEYLFRESGNLFGPHGAGRFALNEVYQYSGKAPLHLDADGTHLDVDVAFMGGAIRGMMGDRGAREFELPVYRRCSEAADIVIGASQSPRRRRPARKRVGGLCPPPAARTPLMFPPA